MEEANDSVGISLEVLRNALPGVHVGTEMPPCRPKERTVMVAQTGGECDGFIDRPVLTLMCWGQTDPEARSLAMDAFYALADAAEDHELLSAAEMVSLSRDEWIPNGQARYMLQTRLAVNL